MIAMNIKYDHVRLIVMNGIFCIYDYNWLFA